jgi:hypothetical protein
MQTYLTVLTAGAESAHRTAALERELEWTRRHGADVPRGAAAPERGTGLPLRWLRRLVAAVG